ncbi:hypothetical protein H7X65_03785, partial [Candidatus Parcubacteria bacterium]|nr:hypothetical protein [Candidatus Parcubacteria bacterium]
TYFLGFIFSIFIWIVTTALFYVSEGEIMNIVIRTVYFAPAFIPMFMILFTKTFPGLQLDYSKRQLFIFLSFPFLFAVLTLIPDIVIKGAFIDSGGIRNIVFGPLYPLYFIYLSIYFIIVTYLMIKKYLYVSGRERNQIEIIFLSLILGSIAGIYNSLIMPTFGSFGLFWAGSFYTGYLVLAVFYGIIRYGLFDVKLVAAEFLTLSTWVIMFAKIFYDKTAIDRVIDSVILVLIIASGILIIRAVMKEIYLREKDDVLVNNITGLNKKLEKTNIELKALDQKKSEFMSLATHQLRAPLTAMKGYSSMILDGTFGKIENPEMEDAINKIARSTTDLTMIVEDYLNISRIEQGRMQYNFSTFDAVGMLKNIINEVKPTVERARLALNLNYDQGTTYMISADEGKIKQVFLNVIDNAIKYTPEGHIDVFLTKTSEGKLIVKIKDTGVGIKSEVIPSLFHKFVRAPDASKINILGTGLGLYVAGEILKAHNGRAWGESNGEGQGSSFYIELSLANR